MAEARLGIAKNPAEPATRANIAMAPRSCPKATVIAPSEVARAAPSIVDRSLMAAARMPTAAAILRRMFAFKLFCIVVSAPVRPSNMPVTLSRVPVIPSNIPVRLSKSPSLPLTPKDMPSLTIFLRATPIATAPPAPMSMERLAGLKASPRPEKNS